MKNLLLALLFAFGASFSVMAESGVGENTETPCDHISDATGSETDSSRSDGTPREEGEGVRR